jgi:transposase
MPQSRTLSIGMDVHKESIAVASVAQEHHAEVISLGALGTRQCDIDQFIRNMPSKSKHLVFVSEAGPCGYWLSRSRTKKRLYLLGGGSIADPQKARGSGQNQPARRHHTGPPDALGGPDTRLRPHAVDDEAMRDLCRAREETIHDLKAAKFRLKAFLLRHDIRYTGRATWSPAHLRWLSEVVCPTPAQQIVFQAYVRAVTEHTERLARLEQELTDQVPTWRLAPVVDALQALRGGPCTVAVTTGAELGDLTRFEHPRQLMNYLGLTPSEYSTGERRRQGGITNYVWRKYLSPSRISVGRPRYDYVNAIGS